MSSTEFCWRSTTTTPVTVEAMVLASRILDNSSLATDRAFATRIWKSCALDYFVAVQHYYQTVQQLDFNVDVTVCSPAFPHLVERLRLLEYLLHTRSPHQGALPFSVGGSLFAAGRNIALRGSVVVVDESGGVSNIPSVVDLEQPPIVVVELQRRGLLHSHLNIFPIVDDTESISNK